MKTADDLLRPLTPDQQALIDCVADAFRIEDDWPCYDYVESVFERDRKDAADVLAGLPRLGRWNYGALWWQGQGGLPQPNAGDEVALTLLGMHHSGKFHALLEDVFGVIAGTIELRRNSRASRRKPRDLSMTQEHFAALIKMRRPPVFNPREAAINVHRGLAHEPLLGSFSPVDADETFTVHWSRVINEYEGVESIEDYVATIERLTALPEPEVAQVTPSPLDLVAALDYLDAVWRLSHRSHIFTYRSAERTAKLAYEANTTEEFDSRLSSLGEILRSANAAAKTSASAKLPRATRDKPLAPLAAYLSSTVQQTGTERVRQAVNTLEHALALRDAAQHTEASDRAIRALNALSIGYPIPDVRQAWEITTSRVVEALGAIREELASLSP